MTPTEGSQQSGKIRFGSRIPGPQGLGIFDTPLANTVFRDAGWNSISFPEKEGFNKWPGRLLIQGLGEDIRWVLVRRDVVEPNITGSNCFSDAVIGKSIPAFGQGRMGNGGAGNNRLIITKHPGGTIQGDTEGTEGIPEINDLFNSTSSSHKFRAIGGSLNLALPLGKPINGGLVEEVENARN